MLACAKEGRERWELSRQFFCPASWPARQSVFVSVSWESGARTDLKKSGREQARDQISYLDQDSVLNIFSVSNVFCVRAPNSFETFWRSL
jgi:hypothetical protein